GNTYNRAEIKEWFKRSRVEPMTQIHLTEKQTKILIPNHRMVEQVIDYLRKIAEQRAQAAHSGPLPVLAQEAEASNCMSTSNNARESRVNKIMRARQQRHAELFLAAFTQRQEQAQQIANEAQQIANEAQPDLEAGQQNANTAPLLTPRGTYQ
ncbi:MAG TPA: U-box domain-containing protein, partial [Gammaproteobacteria bacterium]|nr:U-box domain-containing protein [Gammaproteobacteria bacterium]